MRDGGIVLESTEIRSISAEKEVCPIWIAGDVAGAELESGSMLMMRFPEASTVDMIAPKRKVEPFGKAMSR